jgi:hypothetical protein
MDDLKIVRESVFILDHDMGILRADTTDRATAGRLVRAGFVEITEKSAHPYRRFTGKPDQILIRKGKKKGGKGNTDALRKAREVRVGLGQNEARIDAEASDEVREVQPNPDAK